MRHCLNFKGKLGSKQKSRLVNHTTRGLQKNRMLAVFGAGDHGVGENLIEKGCRGVGRMVGHIGVLCYFAKLLEENGEHNGSPTPPIIVRDLFWDKKDSFEPLLPILVSQKHNTALWSLPHLVVEGF